MSQETLNQFFQDILQDQDLQERLSHAHDLESFVAIAMKISEEKGYVFTEAEMMADIEAAQNQNNILLLTEDELEAMADNTKPWKRFITQMQWARGKNYDLWAKIQKRKSES
jgi:hypothetical protein